MPTYQKQPNSKDTPSRKSRKTERSKVFVYNSKVASQLRKKRKLERKQSEEEQTEE